MCVSWTHCKQFRCYRNECEKRWFVLSMKRQLCSHVPGLPPSRLFSGNATLPVFSVVPVSLPLGSSGTSSSQVNPICLLQVASSGPGCSGRKLWTLWRFLSSLRFWEPISGSRTIISPAAYSCTSKLRMSASSGCTGVEGPRTLL